LAYLSCATAHSRHRNKKLRPINIYRPSSQNRRNKRKMIPLQAQNQAPNQGEPTIAAKTGFATQPKRRQGRMLRKMLPALLGICFTGAHANPTGPQLVAGQASFLQQGNLLTITNSPNTILN
jgi:hypothetical protein